MNPAHIALMAAVAERFFGEPNLQLSKNGELRFGTHGSKSVDLKKGVWFDHEAGQGGGPIKLIMREIGLAEAREAYAWAERQGFWSNGRSPKPKGRTEVAHYDYPDEGGKLLYQKVRYEPKWFSLRRPDGNGGWITGKGALNGVRRVVYRLPEVVETISMGRTIYLVEGEKDADNCWKIGIPATCNYDGGGKWKDEQTKTFAGANVVAITDNDETGHKHGNVITTKLGGVAKNLRVFAMATLWPECPPKGDMSKWIEQTNGTAEQFYALIAQASALKPEPQTSSLGEWDAGDDFGQIEPRPWLLGNQFCRGFISTLFAAGGVGKTSLRLLQYISLAFGPMPYLPRLAGNVGIQSKRGDPRSLCGQHVFQRCRVLLISLEDDDKELKRRVKAVCMYYGINQSDLKGWLFCKSVVGDKLAERNGKFDRAEGPLAAKIRDAIAILKPDLIGLDPFVKLHSLTENDSADMDFVCSLLTRIAVEQNIALDLPHHVHKGIIEPGDADAGRGSSGIRDAGRLVYTLSTMSADEAKAFDIDAADRFDFIRLDRAKTNITRRSGSAEWFKLVEQPLGNGNATYPAGDNMQVAVPWNPPDAWSGLDNKALNRILDIIDAGILDDNGKPTGERYSAQNAAKKRSVLKAFDDIADDKTPEQRKTIIKAWIKTGLLCEDEYNSEVSRKKESGLYVIDDKRPGTVETDEHL